MASTSANGDILASILAELRDLKSSHASLEQRLESLAISGSRTPSRSTTPITANAGSSSSSSAAPIAIGARSPGGGAGGLSTSAGSPPVLSQFAAGSPSSPGSGYQRKASVDYNSIGNAAKQEYLNWTRSNSGTPQGGISASDPNGKSSGRTESDAATRAIYPSRAILTSAFCAITSKLVLLRVVHQLTAVCCCVRSLPGPGRRHTAAPQVGRSHGRGTWSHPRKSTASLSGKEERHWRLRRSVLDLPRSLCRNGRSFSRAEAQLHAHGGSRERARTAHPLIWLTKLKL